MTLTAEFCEDEEFLVQMNSYKVFAEDSVLWGKITVIKTTY
jgi:hypothetical protein